MAGFRCAKCGKVAMVQKVCCGRPMKKSWECWERAQAARFPRLFSVKPAGRRVPYLSDLRGGPRFRLNSCRRWASRPASPTTGRTLCRR